MKKFFKSALVNFFLVSVPTVLVLFVLAELVVFRYIVPASDFPLRRFDPEYKMIKYQPGMTGHVRMRPDVVAFFNTNNHGWNAPVDYSKKKHRGAPRIAVFGDSFIDALMVDIDKTMPWALERALGRRGVKAESYAFGMSGAPLSQYVHMMRYAAAEFDPDLYVVNLIHNDFLESLTRHQPVPAFMTYRQKKDGTFEEVPPAPYTPNPKKRLLFKSRTVRYFYFNLKLKDINFTRQFINKPKPGTYEANVEVGLLRDWDLINDLTRHMFIEFKRIADKRHARLLLVMDTPRQYIYRGQDPRQCVAYKLNDIARKNARSLGIPFLDLTDGFITDYAKHHKIFEFKWDGHWSAYGHGVAGAATSDFIVANKILAPAPRPKKP